MLTMAKHEKRERQSRLFGTGERRRFKGGGGGGGGGQTNTVQKADPWSGQQPYLTDVMGRAQTQSNTPMQYYQGQTYAPVSTESDLAMQLQTQRALAGSPLLAASQDQLTRTMRGDYLDPATNPYLQAGYDSIAAKVLPAIQSRFSGSGRTNSAMASRAASEGMTDAMGQFLMQNYMTERQNQLRGMEFAPQLAQQDYADIARLQEVGTAREDIEQQRINDEVARFNFNQSEPWQRLGMYSNLVQGHYGGTTETQMPSQRRSIGAGALGGAASGGGLGWMFSGGNPYAAAGGAALGGLLGTM